MNKKIIKATKYIKLTRVIMRIIYLILMSEHITI